MFGSRPAMMRTRIFTSGLLLKRAESCCSAEIGRRAKSRQMGLPWRPFPGGRIWGGLYHREATDESGLDVRIKQSARVFEFRYQYGRVVGLPYLLESDSDDVFVNEHNRFDWINPKKYQNTTAFQKSESFSGVSISDRAESRRLRPW